MILVPTITEQWRALFRVDAGGADTWVDADRVVLDGAGVNVVSLVDYIDSSHVFTQATSSAQNAAPVAWSSARNALAFQCAGAQSYASNRAASAWVYCHSGTGMTTISVSQQTTLSGSPNILDSLANLTTIGWRSRYRSATAGLHSTGISNGSQGNVLAFADVTLSGGPPDAIAVYHGNSIGGLNVRFNGAIRRGAGYASARTTANPTQTMTIMGPLAGGGIIGWFAMAAFFRRVLTASELAIAAAYISAKYGGKL